MYTRLVAKFALCVLLMLQSLSPLALPFFGKTLSTANASPVTQSLTPTAISAPVDVVFAIDNTGSMGGTINQVKSNAQYVLDQIRASVPDSYFAAIKFRDYGDDFVTSIVANLTSNTTTVKTAINTMSADGGGDTPEAYIDVVYQAVNQINWRTGSIKLLVIMGDAPPHDPFYGTGTNPNGWRWAGAASVASNSGVKVSMIAVGYGVGDSLVQQSYQYMATATGGIYRVSPDAATLASNLIQLIQDLSGNTPIVTARFPAASATGVPTNSDITASFNIPLDPATVNSYTVLVSSDGAPNRIGTVTYDSTARTMRFRVNLFTPLNPGATYKVTLTSGIKSMPPSSRSLAVTTWSFTTYGTPRERLVSALDQLRAEIASTVDFNARQVANLLGTAKVKTQVNGLKLAAEWVLTLLGFFGGSQPPLGLPSSVVDSLKFFKALSLSKHVVDSSLWLYQEFDSVPNDETGAQNYFNNSLQANAPIRDERQDGSVAWSSTGLSALKSDLIRIYNETVATLPGTLTQSQAQAAISHIEDLTAKVRAARSGEVIVGFDDEVEPRCIMVNIGTIYTQKTQFDQVLAHWEDVKSLRNKIFWTKVGGWIAKGVSALCTGGTLGGCAPVGAPVFAASEYVVWGAGLVSGVETIYEYTTLPREQVLIQGISANAANLQESIQLRRLYLGAAAEIKRMVAATSSAPAEMTNSAEPQAAEANIQVLDYQIGDVVLAVEQSVGTGTGWIILQNISSANLNAMGTILIDANHGSGADTVSIAATDLAYLTPGATESLPFTFTLPAARIMSSTGYEAQLFVQTQITPTGEISSSGPDILYFAADALSEIEAYHANPPQTILSGSLENGQLAEQLYTARDTAGSVRFSLAQASGADFDLHVYDRLGHHIGFDYSSNTTDIPTGTSYTGREVQHEMIEAYSALGPFRVQVIAINAMGMSNFSVAATEQRPYVTFLPLVARNYPTDTYEPNNSMAEAYGPLAAGQVYTSYIASAADADFYYFDISTLGQVTIDLSNIGAPSSYYDLYLYDGTGRFLGWGTTSTSSSQIVFQPVFTGRYYIQIYPYGSIDPTRPYRLKVQYNGATAAGDIYGTVYANGSPKSNVPISLNFYDDNTYAYRTVWGMTNSSGQYHFRGMSTLGTNQVYYVYYRGSLGSSYIGYWYSGDLTSYAAGGTLFAGNPDISPLNLGTPNSTTGTSFPVTFTWTPRATNPSEAYYIYLYDPSNSSTYYWSSNLGHVGSFTLYGLPSGFTTGRTYRWRVYAYGSDGSGSGSYYTNNVAFSSSGATVYSAPAPVDRISPEQVQPGHDKQDVIPLGPQ